MPGRHYMGWPKGIESNSSVNRHNAVVFKIYKIPNDEEAAIHFILTL